MDHMAESIVEVVSQLTFTQWFSLAQFRQFCSLFCLFPSLQLLSASSPCSDQPQRQISSSDKLCEHYFSITR